MEREEIIVEELQQALDCASFAESHLRRTLTHASPVLGLTVTQYLVHAVELKQQLSELLRAVNLEKQ